jgi:hypothetical protein
MITTSDLPVVEFPANPADTPAPRKRGGGPKTPEGRERSRRNALKHGPCSKEVLPDDLAKEVARRTAEFFAEFQPRTPYQAFLVREMALASVRLDRCAEMSILNRGRVRQRASLIWDHDRRVAVEETGAKLAKDPARVARALRGRKQGADWLIERWELLGEILKNKGAWTDAQRRLALDLLGVPVELRDGNDIVPPADDVEAMAELVADQIAMLAEDQEGVLDALDAEERSLALEGMPAEEDAASSRLRKYEASCRRAFHAARAELLRLREAEEPKIEPARPEPSLPGAALMAEAEATARRAEDELARSLGASAERPAVAPSSRPSSREAIAPTASAPRNRRERRASEKRARQAARRAGR